MTRNESKSDLQIELLSQQVRQLQAALAELASRAAWSGSGVIDADGHSEAGLRALMGLVRDHREGRFEHAIHRPEETR
jgi:hypothetical protein